MAGDSFTGSSPLRKTFVVPTPIRSINEPTGSARFSYTPLEAESLLSDIQVQQYTIKPGIAWMFIWGQKG
jgi:hypothetical protein